MNLINAELEEVCEVLQKARARVVRSYGPGTYGMDVECSNADKVAKKGGWKDEWYNTTVVPKTSAKAGGKGASKSSFSRTLAEPSQLVAATQPREKNVAKLSGHTVELF